MSRSAFANALAVGVILAGMGHPAVAQDLTSVPFKTRGQCMSALSQYFTSDWRGTGETGRDGPIAQYDQRYRCERHGDHWYFVPF